MPNEDFETELRSLINRRSLENGSDTPDFILAAYLKRCLDNFDETVRHREAWCGNPPKARNPKQEHEESDLRDVLRGKVNEWVDRVAPRIRDDCDYATLKITLLQPQVSDDGVSLYLDVRLEEKSTTDVGELGGRLPNHRRI